MPQSMSAALPIGSEMITSKHTVQFYESDAFLVDAAGTYIGKGLRNGEAGIVLATKSHQAGIEERMRQDGLDIASARVRGQYITLDAADALATFMVDGSPDPKRFTEVFGNIIREASQRRSAVRIFGELVTLLCAVGNPSAAIRLEELWNRLGKSLDFSLFCTYPMRGFDGEVFEEDFRAICMQHSHVLPAESYSALTSQGERLLAITQLQQKANSLEFEIAMRKQAEYEHYRLAAIVESSNDAIVSKTLDGIITSWNQAAEVLFGYSEQEVIGKPITIIIPPDLQSEEKEIISKLRQGIRIQHFETVRLRKDGTSVDVSLSISPIKDGMGNIIGAAKIARDITERKELERRKDEFIGIASHELKTPVTVLKGFAQVLQRRFQSRDDPESLRFLTRMNTQLDKLTRLINELLDISKIQNGRLVYRMEKFDLLMLAQEIIENVQAALRSHHILLETATEAEVCIYGDRDRIGQVIMNLLTNAIKYSRGAERVIVRIMFDGELASLSVQDFGIGIDEAYHEKIFERFYQVTEPAEQTYPGLGIGLYFSREIIQRHQGRLCVQSRKGEGSTFTFSLPLASE
ncbi:MAG TPA: PAS domain S-box protein [Ktedonobacteraceae bacterium]|nr:PAS domain S-box protein [Ktedonobacteraceae bacterium]